MSDELRERVARALVPPSTPDVYVDQDWFSYGSQADQIIALVLEDLVAHVPAWVQRFTVELSGEPALDSNGGVIWYDRSVAGEGSTLLDALNSAINMAKVQDEET